MLRVLEKSDADREEIGAESRITSPVIYLLIIDRHALQTCLPQAGARQQVCSDLLATLSRRSKLNNKRSLSWDFEISVFIILILDYEDFNDLLPR